MPAPSTEVAVPAVLANVPLMPTAPRHNDSLESTLIDARTAERPSRARRDPRSFVKSNDEVRSSRFRRACVRNVRL